jgi:serine/threonine protein kinase
MEAMNADKLGHFALLEKIGEGGMGQVYKARDVRLGRLVAIKLLPQEKLADADRRARFIQEAKAASALNHPNIITIYDIGEQDGQTFIVMELVGGKPLNELIPRKGMRLSEALSVATQVSDALTVSHSAGIVHRDLKPANIMVDTHGRAKVLDFGLAKLSAPAIQAVDTSEATRTRTVEQPRTDEGVILGSVPYMSPEQAEGKVVDARSDIFSFGAVLYEMVTGQRAFRGESALATLAAVVEKQPQSPREINGDISMELERLIARCLRKDINRRRQSMADVKVALEELRDESESGKLARSPATTPAAGTHRWLWPALAIASVLAAGAVIAWTYVGRGGGIQSRGPDLVRLSPDDGYSYYAPSISADGKFVAYVSDRSGSRQVWLHQVAGGEPLQLTHSNDPVMGARFLPDGASLGYVTNSADANKGSIELIPTLGGQPRVVASTKRLLGGALSQDGRQLAYFESLPSPPWARLWLLSYDDGQQRELTSWAAVQPFQASYELSYFAVVWSPDNHYLLCLGRERSDASNREEWEWFALPVDGGSARSTGAGPALRAAGLNPTPPDLVFGDRVLFSGGKSGRHNIWEIRISPKSWHVRSAPRQITFGTENEYPHSISASGIVALDLLKESSDLYLIPLSTRSGQPTGVARRLTRDGRDKTRWSVGGAPGSAYFLVDDAARRTFDGYALDLGSGKQTLLAAAVPYTTTFVVSLDGRRIAYSIPEGGSYSIAVGDAGGRSTAARLLCKGCGKAARFSADGRFLFYQPEVKVKSDPERKRTVRLLNVASGADRAWLEHPHDSIMSIGTFGEDLAWLTIDVRPVGAEGQDRPYIVPWREEPVPPSEWIEVKLPRTTDWNYAPYGNFFQFFQGTKLMTIRFDPKRRAFSEPAEVRYLPGSAETVKPDDSWGVRGPGLVFSRQESISSVWLMKLPR